MQTFSKAERLSSKTEIDAVFEKGKTTTVSGFKIHWLLADEKQAFPVQIVISVPKRNFKRAVDRNLLKRRIREAYRKNKNGLYEKINSKTYNVMLVYTGKIILEYAEIEERIKLVVQRLISEFTAS